MSVSGAIIAAMSKDDAKKLDGLLVRQSGKCHWCGCKIVRPDSISRDKIVIERRYFVVWRNGGDRTEQALIGSAVSLDGNGTYAAACKQCSEERPKVQPKPKPAPLVKASDTSRVVFW